MPTSLEEKLTPLLKEVACPISEDNPAGEDITYDDDFLALKDEIDQISSVNPEGVDYDGIVETCCALLGKKSKDLRVSTYLAMALGRTQGYRGVWEGLLAQKLLVDAFWEALYPPMRRMRARKNAFQFMAERLVYVVAEGHPSAEDRAALEGALAVLQEVQGFVVEAMGEDAPVLSGLRKALDDALRKAPRPASPAATPVAEAEPPPASKPVSAPQRAEPPWQAASLVPPSVAAAEPQSDTEALEQVLKVAAFLRAQNPASAFSYRLARCVLWDAVVTDPTNEQGRTLLEDLAPHRLTYLDTLVGEADWAALLKEAEDIFKEPPYHFVLDLQRFVVTAMDGLGAAYQLAKQAVLYETALLVKRLPGLLRLTFMEGMPFADPATQFWIEQTVEPVLGSGSAEGPSGEEDQALAGEYDAAKKLFSEGDLGAALRLLQDGLEQDNAPRNRFRRRFYMALLCMQGNQPAIACPILENLDAEIDTYSLHAWEPALALEVWNHLYRCYEVLRSAEGASQDGLDERARRVFAKISQVDVTQALKASRH